MNHQRSLEFNSDNNLNPTFANRQDYRNRQILINKVKNYWLKGVLEKSIPDNSYLEISLEERLDAIESPWGVAWENPTHSRSTLTPDKNIIDFFAEMGEGRSLLILGAPGSGKTIALLQLAADLIAKAENNINEPIPIVLNLSSLMVDFGGGIERGEAVVRWLIEELNINYQIPRHVAQTWIAQQQLLLLLDGLDEVVEESRSLCVAALNEFSKEYGRTEIVVCSRDREYQVLSQRLRLQGAIYLNNLTDEQIDRYLTAGDRQITGLKELLDRDRSLRELVKTPLMLNIIATACEQMGAEELQLLSQGNGDTQISLEASRKRLLNAYIQRMFSRRGNYHPYSQKEALKWLKEIALRMSIDSKTIFFIERLQPDWLQLNRKHKFKLPWQKNRKYKSKLYNLYGTGVQLISGLIWALLVVFTFSVAGGYASNVFVGSVVAGILGAAMTNVDPIQPVEKLRWSWLKAQQWLPMSALLGLAGLLSAGVPWGLFLGLSGVAVAGTIEEEHQTKSFPNQGIWLSAKRAATFGFGGAVLCLVGGIGLQGTVGFDRIVSTSLFGTGILSFALALMKGGTATIKHFVLRAILSFNRSLPWNLADFLNYATERNLLQRVGGGYIFVDRLVQEYLSDLARQEYQLEQRIDPHNAIAYLERANTKASLGDATGAIADYNQAIEIDANLAAAFAGRSLARYILRDDSGALEDYQITHSLDPNLARSITYTVDRVPKSSALTKSEGDCKYLVTLLNDNVNTFDYVCDCLMKYVPKMNGDRAWQLTMQVHNQGQAIVWSGPEHLAQLYHAQLSQAGLSLDACWPEVE
ncbi:MAG: ATP-dependent Clp protease adaptor ClpS [Prochloraceae cyanobacterium]|nr:ATP-dependent Clp protease adaptor ClpS [Prochloraceae cyanobacterium]